MDSIELKDRFAKMWRKSREDSGKSQAYVAKALGVSRITVQNWEAGLSCPSQEKAFEWFVAVDRQPLPYYLDLLYPGTFTLDDDASEEEIDEALFQVMSALPYEIKKKLLFILTAQHGSSPVAVIEMVVAHLHAPLASRLNVAHNILSNYQISVDLGTDVAPKCIGPDVDLLDHAYRNGVDAVRTGRSSYVALL